jgi:hypothetical protein
MFGPLTILAYCSFPRLPHICCQVVTLPKRSARHTTVHTLVLLRPYQEPCNLLEGVHLCRQVGRQLEWIRSAGTPPLLRLRRYTLRGVELLCLAQVPASTAKQQVCPIHLQLVRQQMQPFPVVRNTAVLEQLENLLAS